jgi:hypothetical protein
MSSRIKSKRVGQKPAPVTFPPSQKFRSPYGWIRRPKMGGQCLTANCLRSLLITNTQVTEDVLLWTRIWKCMHVCSVFLAHSQQNWSNCPVLVTRSIIVPSIPLWNLPGNFSFVGFEVPAAVVMKHSTFWDITPCSPSRVNLSCLPPAFTLVSCSDYSSSLNMDATCSS